jgi:hypothetical protein
MGLMDVGAIVPHTNYPLLLVYHFSILNRKMVIGLTNQLPIVFEEGHQDQLAHLKGMVSTLCTSHSN